MPIPNGGIVRHLVKVNCLFVAIALGAIAPQPASAQRYFYKTTTLKIIGTDSVPVPFAVITVDGEPRIANEKGELDIGKATDKTMELEIRRIGYAPLVGTVVFPDSETLKVLILARISQNLSPVVVNASSASAALESAGFYSRWLNKQKNGPQGATFIGPEVIDQRNPAVTTDLLSKVYGVTLQTDVRGVRVPMGTGLLPTVGSTFARVAPASSNDRGACYMSILIDGRAACPNVGCHYVFPSEPPGSRPDDHSVDIDKLVAAKDVAGIEVYPRKDGMPDYVLKAYEGCGVVSIWTKAH
jgi:hypothetical protein